MNTDTPLLGISSMATRQMLAALLRLWQARGGTPARIESVGGVDAARRVQAGQEPFDLVLLAADAIARLAEAGRIVPGSQVDLARSSVAVAVPAGAARPDIGSGASVRQAILAAPTIGYSTGPSGVALQQLFAQWGIAEQLRERTVQAPPGVPVGALIASGEVALGFQQLSELIHLPGIELLGLLPADIAISTLFSAAVVAGSAREEEALGLLTFMASAEAAPAKRAEGLEPMSD